MKIDYHRTERSTNHYAFTSVHRPSLTKAIALFRRTIDARNASKRRTLDLCEKLEEEMRSVNEQLESFANTVLIPLVDLLPTLIDRPSSPPPTTPPRRAARRDLTNAVLAVNLGDWDAAWVDAQNGVVTEEGAKRWEAWTTAVDKVAFYDEALGRSKGIRLNSAVPPAAEVIQRVVPSTPSHNSSLALSSQPHSSSPPTPAPAHAPVLERSQPSQPTEDLDTTFTPPTVPPKPLPVDDQQTASTSSSPSDNGSPTPRRAAAAAALDNSGVGTDSGSPPPDHVLISSGTPKEQESVGKQGQSDTAHEILPTIQADELKSTRERPKGGATLLSSPHGSNEGSGDQVGELWSTSTPTCTIAQQIGFVFTDSDLDADTDTGLPIDRMADGRIKPEIETGAPLPGTPEPETDSQMCGDVPWGGSTAGEMVNEGEEDDLAVVGGPLTRNSPGLTPGDSNAVRNVHGDRGNVMHNDEVGFDIAMDIDEDGHGEEHDDDDMLDGVH
ncbi:hypothetical protein HDU93_009283 [Gonapodya sp. JEL0774]|nr:hypothetical protein HDU93_009283 [Gonapodya sp. JEL0774]